jgi:hypothetical protein
MLQLPVGDPGGSRHRSCGGSGEAEAWSAAGHPRSLPIAGLTALPPSTGLVRDRRSRTLWGAKVRDIGDLAGGFEGPVSPGGGR